MWIHFEPEQLEMIKGVMTVMAEGEEHDAKLFWTDEHAETRNKLLKRAKDYREIALTIENKVTEFDPADPYRAYLQGQADDEMEVDDDAIVSGGSDPGAFVMAWIWVSNSEAGLPDPDNEEDNSDD